MKTQSFTIRLPIEILDAIAEKAQEGKRSEFVIQLLREGLGLESEEEKTVRESTVQLIDRVNELSYKLEIFQTTQDKVLQRITALESAIQSNTDSKTGIVLQGKTKSTTNKPVLQEDTGSKTVEETKNLELLPEDTTIPDNAEKMNSADLVKLLKGVDEGWNAQKLRLFREDRKKNSWHRVGQYKFKFAEHDNSTKRPEYFWWIVDLER